MTDKKEKAVSLESVKAAADASDEKEEVKVDIPTPEGMVKVKNITNVNIFTSKGKIPAKSEGFCTKEDAAALKAKELALEI